MSHNSVAKRPQEGSSSPPIQGLFQVEHDQGKKRPRTKKACDYCRNKKIRCNGESPCGNCSTHNHECTYRVAHNTRKQRVAKTQTSSSNIHENKSIQDLSSRLSSLENVISNLVSKLDNSGLLVLAGSNREPVEKDIVIRKNPESETVSPYIESLSQSSSSGDELFMETESSNMVSNQLSKRSTEMKMRQMLIPKANTAYDIVCDAKDRVLQYFGSHNMICTFSTNLIAWIKGRINKRGEKDLLMPLTNLPLALNQAIHSNISSWTKISVVTNKSSKLYFSHEDKNFIFESLELYYERANVARYLCSLNTVRELFQIYYYTISNADMDVTSRISQSEFLIMNIAIALCLTNPTETEVDKANYPFFATKSKLDLTRLKEKYFKNAVSCYKKIAVVYEGIRSIQGIALLTLYMEATYVTDFHINFILSSVMIRYAFNLGLHTVASNCEDDTEDMRDLKRVLWWYCEYINMDVCHRSGKPSLINYKDVSTLTEDDDHFLSIPRELFKSDAYKANACGLLKKCEDKGFQFYYFYFSLMLTRIKAKSYEKLYNNQASILEQDEVINRLQEINDDMFSMAKLIEPEIRPTLYYMKRTVNSDFVRRSWYGDLFDIKCPFFHYSTLSLQVTFFAHLLSINRIPFVNRRYENSERTRKYGNLALESTRTILHLVVNLEKTEVPRSITKWVTFYPFIAYCGLLGHCSTFPKEESTRADVQLLIRVSMDFFATGGLRRSNLKAWEVDKVYDNKNIVLDLISRLWLRVLINLMEEETSSRYIDEIPGLREHFEQCSGIYPDLFKNPESFKNPELSRPLSMIINEVDDGQSKDTENATPFQFDFPTQTSNDVEEASTFPDFLNALDGDINFEMLSDETFSSLITSQFKNLPNMYTEGNLDFSNFDNNYE
ncbi:uncharacterized protein RJT20DRAFT_6893 [Scheffersomyces xylosifermentans]|uniref:uncharacterized protein n=1 Tax=Scheffersomyces xylosifermentans TaxID=1304137 RepID=UPI00315CC7DE